MPFWPSGGHGGRRLGSPVGHLHGCELHNSSSERDLRGPLPSTGIWSQGRDGDQSSGQLAAAEAWVPQGLRSFEVSDRRVRGDQVANLFPQQFLQLHGPRGRPSRPSATLAAEPQCYIGSWGGGGRGRCCFPPRCCRHRKTADAATVLAAGTIGEHGASEQVAVAQSHPQLQLQGRKGCSLPPAPRQLPSAGRAPRGALCSNPSPATSSRVAASRGSMSGPHSLHVCKWFNWGLCCATDWSSGAGSATLGLEGDNQGRGVWP